MTCRSPTSQWPRTVFRPPRLIPEYTARCASRGSARGFFPSTSAQSSRCCFPSYPQQPTHEVQPSMVNKLFQLCRERRWRLQVLALFVRQIPRSGSTKQIVRSSNLAFECVRHELRPVRQFIPTPALACRSEPNRLHGLSPRASSHRLDRHRTIAGIWLPISLDSRSSPAMPP